MPWIRAEGLKLHAAGVKGVFVGATVVACQLGSVSGDSEVCFAGQCLDDSASEGLFAHSCPAFVMLTTALGLGVLVTLAFQQAWQRPRRGRKVDVEV